MHHIATVEFVIIIAYFTLMQVILILLINHWYFRFPFNWPCFSETITKQQQQHQ